VKIAEIGDQNLIARFSRESLSHLLAILYCLELISNKDMAIQPGPPPPHNNRINNQKVLIPAICTS
jgi:hypothetical protein